MAKTFEQPLSLPARVKGQLGDSRAKQDSRILTLEEINKLKRIVTNKYSRQSPDLKNFSDIYSATEITADQAEVSALKESFAKDETPADQERHFYGTLFEMLIMEFASSWLPGYIAKTSEYDDLKNGTDLTWELRSDTQEILRLAIDVTIDNQRAEEKIAKVQSQLKRGKLQSVKYFLSDLGESKGPQSLFKIVIGTDKVKLAALAKLYLHYSESPSGNARAHWHEQIAAYPFAEQFLYQTLVQLDKFIQIIKDNDPHNLKTEQLEYLQAWRRALENAEMEKA